MQANIIFFVVTMANAIFICPKNVESCFALTHFSSFSLIAGRKKHKINTADKTNVNNINAMLIRVVLSNNRFAPVN
jgi:hypothetical protein